MEKESTGDWEDNTLPGSAVVKEVRDEDLEEKEQKTLAWHPHIQ